MWFTLMSLAAVAAPHAAEADVDAHHQMLGAKGVVLAMPGEHDGWEAYAGPGLFGESKVGHTPLHIEAAGAWLWETHSGSYAAPFDVLLKLDARAGHTDLFVGAGPMLTLMSHGHSELVVHPGLLGSAGAAWWFAHDVGLLVEADGGLSQHGAEGLLPEVEGGLGLVFGL